MNNSKIVIFPDAASLAEEAARYFIDLAKKTIQTEGKISVALAGGSTPKLMYELLAERFSNDMDWENVYIFLSDERFVPPDHIDSTYRMIYETLFSKVRIPVENIFKVPTVGCTIAEAAKEYSESLIKHLGEDIPRLDLVMLGMGPDGHTASLFPNSPALNSTKIVDIIENSPKPPPLRITFTFPLINNAKNVLTMVTGSDKAEVLKKVLQDERDINNFPAQGINPLTGEMRWFIDQKAAVDLS